ncbi:MAG: Flp/Fap pilin component [Frankiaceae bacterium]|jgi:pilus assembly protein Flp/PilA|nr:Flp/Fap pilin component [Frankiaceae bacterium]
MIDSDECRPRESGASSVEYSILVAAIAAVIVAAVMLLGAQTQTMYQTTCDSIVTGAGTTQTC